jgi:hypothetical protein
VQFVGNQSSGDYILAVSDDGAGDVTFNLQGTHSSDLTFLINNTGSGEFNLDVNGDADISGNITVGGTVDNVDIQGINMYGSSNAVDIPCILEGADNIGQNEHRLAVRLETYGSGNPVFTYHCPLPTTKGGLDLKITAIKFQIHDVDSNDFVTTNYLYGIGDTSITSIETDTTNYTTTGLKTHSFGGPQDMSSYKAAKVYIATDTAGSLELDIGAVYVTAYYS